jgi:hypothetical protein
MNVKLSCQIAYVMKHPAEHTLEVDPLVTKRSNVNKMKVRCKKTLKEVST